MAFMALRLSSLMTRDAVAHVGEAAAIDEIDDELEFVKDFEVGALGLIAGFDESFESALDEGADAAAEHGLLAEEVGFGLFFECGLKDSGAGAADALKVAQVESVGVAGCILMDGDEAGDAAAFSEDLADTVAGSLGCGHADVDAGYGEDGFEVDVEAVSEEEHLARGEVGGDLFGVEPGGGLVGDEDHNDVGPASDFGDGTDFEAGLLGLGDGFGVGGEADFYLNAGVLEVEGVGVALGAVADDADLFGLDEREVGVVIVMSGCHIFLDFLCERVRGQWKVTVETEQWTVDSGR
jgi:hypothetical protein